MSEFKAFVPVNMNYLFAFNFVSGHRINGHIQIRTFDEIKTTLEHDAERGTNRRRITRVDFET